jgi:hypothetical protein
MFPASIIPAASRTAVDVMDFCILSFSHRTTLLGDSIEKQKGPALSEENQSFTNS